MFDTPFPIAGETLIFFDSFIKAGRVAMVECAYATWQLGRRAALIF
jgi:hypothetical protein